MLSRSPHFSRSNSQLWGAQPIPHRTPISQPPLSLFLLGAAAQQALGLLISIHLPDPPRITPFSAACTSAPHRDTPSPAPSLSWGAPQPVSPSLCQALGAVPPSVGGLWCIPPLQHPGTPGSLGHPHLGCPFSGGHTRCPCLACLGTTLASHPACHAPAAHPALGLLPFPSAQHRGGPWSDTGEQTATLPSPAPTAYGTQQRPLSALVWADILRTHTPGTSWRSTGSFGT